MWIFKIHLFQIRELHAMANGKQIGLDILKGQKTIMIAGTSKNVMDFTDSVQRYSFDTGADPGFLKRGFKC